MLYVTTALLRDKTGDATLLIHGSDFPATYVIFSGKTEM